MSSLNTMNPISLDDSSDQSRDTWLVEGTIDTQFGAGGGGLDNKSTIGGGGLFWFESSNGAAACPPPVPQPKLVKSNTQLAINNKND